MKNAIAAAAVMILLAGGLLWWSSGGKASPGDPPGPADDPAGVAGGPAIDAPDAEYVAALRDHEGADAVEDSQYSLDAVSLIPEGATDPAGETASSFGNPDGFLGTVRSKSKPTLSGRLKFTREAGIPAFLVFALAGYHDEEGRSDWGGGAAQHVEVAPDGRFRGELRVSRPGSFLLKVVTLRNSDQAGGGTEQFYCGVVRVLPREGEAE